MGKELPLMTGERGEHMRYGTVVPGRFLSRPNRFIARVEMPEGVETVHVKNTGRCRELLIPGTTVYLEKAEIRPEGPNMT